MGREVYGPTLIRLLQQLAPVKSALGYEVVVVVFAEIPGRVQGVGDDAHGLELRPGIRDGFFVHGERLRKELVRHLLELALIRDLSAEEEQAQGQIGSAHAGVKRRDALVHELVQRRRHGGPFVVEMFAGLVAPSKLDGLSYQRRRGESNAIAAFVKGFLRCL